MANKEKDIEVSSYISFYPYGETSEGIGFRAPHERYNSYYPGDVENLARGILSKGYKSIVNQSQERIDIDILYEMSRITKPLPESKFNDLAKYLARGLLITKDSKQF